MFEKIMVLTDFSAYARKFLECLGDFPEVKDVVILNVVSRDSGANALDPAAKINDSEKKIAKDKKLINVPGINVTTRVVSTNDEDITMGIPSAALRVANEENIELLVMGARGRSLIQSIVLGSITRNLLRLGDKNLLIMRYKMDGNASQKALSKHCPKILSKVLIPTDFSKPADAAISAIKELKGIGEIVLLHVVSKGESDEEIEAAVRSAKDKLNGISQGLIGEGLKVTSRVAVGAPVEAIRTVAREEDASLVAMSSVGENAFKVGKIGNITYDVANTLDRPVLIIRLKVVYNFSF
jgi:nucleotide-binding universal stress UspA family protein